jgi:hypothetical protein
MVDFFGTLVGACGWFCVKATLKNWVVECSKMTLALIVGGLDFEPWCNPQCG